MKLILNKYSCFYSTLNICRSQSSGQADEKSHKTIQLFLANGPVLYLILITKLDI